MTCTVRFAPSPTGLLHVGNARMALVNDLFARKSGGRFVLRLDDTDAERSTVAFAQAIEEDLAWLGVRWDVVERQSARLARYDEAFARLKAQGRVYPCYETPEELDYKRRRLMARGKPPIYDRAGAMLDDAERARFEAEGRRPHWRFKLSDGAIVWDDLVRGPVTFDSANLSDPVIRRADESWLYMLPSAVDDIDMAISHVVRGEDHVANTAVQIQMFEALGSPAPTFAHLPLMTDLSGQGLSKRLGSLSLRELRENGIEATGLASYLARLGTSDDIEALGSLDALAEGFDFSHFSRAAAKFDPDHLSRINTQVIHAMAFAEVRGRLAGLEPMTEAFWIAVRPNLSRLGDAAIWHKVCYGAIDPGATQDREFLHAAADLLPGEPWDAETWKTWTAAVKGATGRKGKALFMPLRLALTGLDHGPELKNLLPIIGRARALERLRGV
ncbi:glutamate--tRNA ligase [Varunaivibrio sulfuroxidans]|uniref:Glutamate--tRNA ligase n=1 Tax=Varunaivibrio sulfuroxidans TaxID=1773489 RepID=A0A4R3J6T7_9PROT|nr:glutamate--tRNA ligase [Varunaivibrio sulfuroxidans]TCS60583.1 glutamyl-tRNA synthetase [Varunaivibrio sulfuroxidans]WES30074.1 glutamate--tRNA ligase [Varunaivibrio sulfuroxidans]